MNNLPGNIQLSQEEDDNLTRMTSKAAIANIEAQLKKLGTNPRLEKKRQDLEDQKASIEDRLTALNAERPTNRDGLSDAARAALTDIEAQLKKLPETRSAEPKRRNLIERRSKILDHAESVMEARRQAEDSIDTDRQPRSRTTPRDDGMRAGTQGNDRNPPPQGGGSSQGNDQNPPQGGSTPTR